MSPKLSVARQDEVREPSASMRLETFGKYRLISPLTLGGMAELFIALQEGVEGFSKVVALKRTLPHLASSEDFVSMFLNEARIASRLDHPNIVHIYDLGQVGSHFFMAMEYLPGEDLARVAKAARQAESAIDPDIIAAIVQAAAHGLHYAHEMTDDDGKLIGLVHRDINPSNLIVTYHGNVKVVDFGIAKATASSSETQAGVIKGKLAYLAPEQVAGKPADRRCDVFCLGIVMWELLTNKRLFARENDVATLSAVIAAEVPTLSSIRQGIHPQLEGVVSKALAKDPELRYQTAGDLFDALEEYFATRTLRPSSKVIGQWLIGLFGQERADAKLKIAKGTGLRTALSVLGDLPKSPGGSYSGVHATDAVAAHGGVDVEMMEEGEEEEVPLKRRAMMIGGLLVFAVAVMAGVVALTNDKESKDAAPKGGEVSYSMSISSEPSGAFIFVNGELTGRQSPTTLNGLTQGGELRIRLEKSGYAPMRDTVVVRDPVTEKKYVLRKAMGRLHLNDIPLGAEVLINGQGTNGSKMIDLPAGEHQIQLRVNGQVTYSRSLEVKSGEQVHSFAR